MSTERMNRSTEQDLTEFLMLGAQLYYPPILVILGGLGNCLSVCVFFCTKMRRSSSSFYLAALAISDTGFLASLFVFWLNMVGLGVFSRPGYCQFFIYLPTLCSFLSVWFVVAFTVERFIAVCYPLRRQSMCTVARAKSILISLTILGLVLCSPVLWFSRPRPAGHKINITVCKLAEEWESWASVFNVADTILTFVLPFTVIVVLNSLIVKSVWRLARVRRTMTTSTRSTKNEKASSSSSKSIPRSTVSQTKITKMLLVVSSVFLCFNLPAYVMRVHAFIKGNEEVPRATVIIQHVCNLLFDTNFGINFVLYCASGQNFRKAVVRMIVGRCRNRNDAEPRASLRANQSGSELGRSGSTIGRQRTIVLEMHWEENCELSDFSRTDDCQRSKYLIRRSSRENK
ncbi:thyrotropin-releasing hormone receptor [Venturia canescens]|uniref:thyrotropin-releasing hormone receptor n=1 Tax=Venturia canescens TaxID=32260 RepID=UPI001C9BE0FE|nr:thyrotropin-releasing hormone receptor [Venturia canescens]